MRLFRKTPKALRAVCISVASFVFAAALGTPALAQLQVDITSGTADPLPIAIPQFYGKTSQEVDNGRNIADLISTDLERSGLFRPIDRRAFIQRVSALQVQPRFGDWRQINAQFLVSGSAQTQTDGRLKVEFRLWDVFGGAQMTGRRYFTTPQNWRRVAHIIADEIYKRITGEDGYFDTRVVYISESGPANRRIKRLSIMDQDGANHRFLTDGRDTALTPRFSPTAQEITYLLLRDKKQPRVFLYNIETGQQEIIGDFQKMQFAPRFSPDGNKVIMSMAKDGNTEVYTMDLRTRRAKRLTNHPAIDTSPSYSPDGRRIVFNSDRSGIKRIYVMNSDGSGVKRISREKGRYSTPVWSPRGDLIAFTKGIGGTFSIGVMRPDGRGERILANGYLVEGPTWAPNGRVLMFFREQRRRSADGSTARLYSIDLTGYNERQIPTPEAGSDPAWSPLVK